MVYSESAVRDAEPSLDDVFAALAHPVRRDVVRYLAGRATAPRMSAVAADNGLSRQLLNKHTATLERAGLVSRVTRGRQSHLVLDPDALDAAQQWMLRTRAFWEQQLDALDAYVAELGRQGTDSDDEAGQA